MRSRLLLVLMLSACPHPPLAPDAPSAAIVAPYDAAQQRWKLEGVIGEAAPITWIQLDVASPPLSAVEVTVTTDGSRDAFDSQLRSPSGSVLATLAPIPGLDGASDIRSATVRNTDAVYVRIAASTTRRSGKFVVVATRTPLPVPPPAKCDRNHFDPNSLACAGECDFHHPDVNVPSCCIVWEKCRVRGTSLCQTTDIRWDGDDVVLPLGLEDGVYGHPSGRLYVRPVEPRLPDGRVPGNVTIQATTVEAHRSVWSVMNAPDHDLAWLRDHSSRVDIPLPPHCPYD
jgi:hypothetical protein